MMVLANLSSLGSRDQRLKYLRFKIPFYYRQPSKALKFTRQPSRLDTLTVNRQSYHPIETLQKRYLRPSQPSLPRRRFQGSSFFIPPHKTSSSKNAFVGGQTQPSVTKNGQRSSSSSSQSVVRSLLTLNALKSRIYTEFFVIIFDSIEYILYIILNFHRLKRCCIFIFTYAER